MNRGGIIVRGRLGSEFVKGVDDTVRGLHHHVQRPLGSGSVSRALTGDRNGEPGRSGIVFDLILIPSHLLSQLGLLIIS